MSGLFEVLDATWPAAAMHRAGPWIVREGADAGKRVSAATSAAPWTAADLGLAEGMQARLGQPDLFQVRSGEATLDNLLADAGYVIVDPVVLRVGATAALAADPPPPLATFTIWPPLAIMCEIWDEGEIGPARRAVMDRCALPKTSVLGRVKDRVAGAAFVAVAGDTAMLHALHVMPDQRRQGIAVKMVRAAAIWAQDHGANRLCVAVTRANSAANALYASLGLGIVEEYHYRLKPTS